MENDSDNTDEELELIIMHKHCSGPCAGPPRNGGAKGKGAQR